uniref:Uncharacterized protein n=1 Tax=Quercus lobata TaxID=97700 RepID=A0A7N2KVQ4_QUELO
MILRYCNCKQHAIVAVLNLIILWLSRMLRCLMKYHRKAKIANFLIKEGLKVKKLAEQYLEAAQQKEKVNLYNGSCIHLLQFLQH